MFKERFISLPRLSGHDFRGSYSPPQWQMNQPTTKKPLFLMHLLLRWWVVREAKWSEKWAKLGAFKAQFLGNWGSHQPYCSTCTRLKCSFGKNMEYPEIHVCSNAEGILLNVLYFEYLLFWNSVEVQYPIGNLRFSSKRPLIRLGCCNHRPKTCFYLISNLFYF